MITEGRERKFVVGGKVKLLGLVEGKLLIYVYLSF